jgi:hypothetical protein
MDHHGNTTDGFSLSTQSITQLIYSCNKFYPRAPDNSKSNLYTLIILLILFFIDAPKFINDDYILACSLENGQVLFLNNYQDQSPIHVDTELHSK